MFIKHFVVLFLALVGVACNVEAAEVYFSWTLPTERENGVPLDLDEIQGYAIYQDGEPVLYVEGGSAQSASYNTGGHYGQVCWTITTLDTDEQESVQSEPHCKEVPKPRPNAPTSLNVSF